LIAGRREVEGGDDAVGGEPALVDLLAMLAVVEEPAECHGRGVRVHLKIIYDLVTKTGYSDSLIWASLIYRWWFDPRLEPIYTTAPATSKNDA